MVRPPLAYAVLRPARSAGALVLALFMASSLCGFAAFRWGWPGAESEVANEEEYRLRNPSIDSLTVEPRIKHWRKIDGIPAEIAQFETVFWEPDDTNSLRTWLKESERVQGATVLEIGTGTGLISLLSRQSGAARVVATDINALAVACARYNIDHLGLDGIEVRQVEIDQPGPFAVVGDDELFDLIISNPPWEDAPVNEPAAYALYDPSFALLDALMSQARQHLNPGGRLLLVYGAKTPIERVYSQSAQHGWTVTTTDPRSLDDLPEVFLPGLLLELSPNE
ncbi:MAG: class I SAM-dependent methyltransferase [Pirellulaceae bacterium]